MRFREIEKIVLDDLATYEDNLADAFVMAQHCM